MGIQGLSLRMKRHANVSRVVDERSLTNQSATGDDVGNALKQQLNSWVACKSHNKNSPGAQKLAATEVSKAFFNEILILS